MSRASSALEAAFEYGGWNMAQDASVNEQEVLDYFTERNFSRMFPGEDPAECGGYTLDECARAVIAWHREARERV